MQRRQFIASILASLGLSSLGARLLAAPYDVFLHGVASGDPLQDRVILWTRVSGFADTPVDVEWRVAQDADMQDIVSTGRLQTSERTDYTVKVDADGLEPGQRYFYQFEVAGQRSPIGRTCTLAEGNLERLGLAVVSCSNFAAGYFHAYRDIAGRDDVDVVIHLGDYIYEYGQGGYATERAAELDRVPDPPHETVSLADYRRRHAQYKSDPDSRAMLARHPLIAVWDDHEITNDAWRSGAENHNRGEGRWSRRCKVAARAYFEWMPIRGEAKGRKTRIFRDFRFGNLASLSMLDTRLYGRDRQPQIGAKMSSEEVMRHLADPRRRMLGREQEAWLSQSLNAAAGTTWQLLGQQVLMSPVRTPDLEPLIDLTKPAAVSAELLQRNIALSKFNPPLLLDTWDGYAGAREGLLRELAARAANPVVLSGDLHTSIAGNLLPAGAQEPVAVEFMTGSVSSPGLSEYLPEARPQALREATVSLNPGLVYMETERRGWLRLELTAEHCQGEWHLIDTVHSHDYHSEVDQTLAVYAGRVHEGLVGVTRDA